MNQHFALIGPIFETSQSILRPLPGGFITYQVYESNFLNTTLCRPMQLAFQSELAVSKSNLLWLVSLS